MQHAVAPGLSGHNLLSKRGLFRVILLRAHVEGARFKLLVLEAEDHSCRIECPASEAHAMGDLLIFDFFPQDRDRAYRCYFDPHSVLLRLDRLPAKMSAPTGQREAP